MQIINQRTATVPIASIAADPVNPNQGDIGAISESIQSSGFFGHVLVQESTGRIIAGAHRHAAARALGATEIPVTFVDVDDERARRIMLADNRTARLGADNPEALAVLLQELAATPAALQGTGYDGDALDELLADLGQMQPDLAGDPDAVPGVPAEPVTKRGDIITLGRHKLLCGDAGDPRDADSLLGGCCPDMLWGDPPYGAHLDTDFSTMGPWSGRDSITHTTGNRYAPVTGDDGPYDPAPLMARLAACPEQFWWGADYYAERIPERAQGAWMVWDKRLDESGDKMFGSCFELCWSKAAHKRDIARIKWAGIFGMAGEPERQRLHPTQKPIALVEWFYERHGKVGDVVADFYGGSGAALIAAERTGRTCYMMEIEPAYCDVIVQRWESLTGKKAEREQVDDDARVLSRA